MLAVLVGGSTVARAGDGSAPPPSPSAAADAVHYGLDVRVREVFLPKAVLGLFVDRAAGGAQSTGLGFDLVRRRGTLELQLGFEFEHINPAEGVYINKGDNVAGGDTADYILSPEHAMSNFGWYTLEFSFINHAVINKYLAFRYGGGLGLGILSGQVKRVDTACVGATNDNVDPGCVPAQYGGTGISAPDHAGDPVLNPYKIPPVFPVVNAIIGLQIRPADKIVINIEGGIRTLPFIGVSAGYFM